MANAMKFASSNIQGNPVILQSASQIFLYHQFVFRVKTSDAISILKMVSSKVKASPFLTLQYTSEEPPESICGLHYTSMSESIPSVID